MDKNFYYSHQMLTDDVMDLIQQLTYVEFKPDVVAGFSRGGLIPAVMMSHYWEIPMIPIRFSTRDFIQNHIESFTEDVRELVGDIANVLVVDDICDSGKTFSEFMSAMDEYNNQVSANAVKMNIKTASLIYNMGQKVYDPHYYAREINKVEDPVWVTFEYENFWKAGNFK
jgi:hypoxanthine phosphoribosyltransferase